VAAGRAQNEQNTPAHRFFELRLVLVELADLVARQAGV
jgi:hypothetical protein